MSFDQRHLVAFCLRADCELDANMSHTRKALEPIGVNGNTDFVTSAHMYDTSIGNLLGTRIQNSVCLA